MITLFLVKCDSSPFQKIYNDCLEGACNIPKTCLQPAAGWTKLALDTVPDARNKHSIAKLDSNIVILFGGSNKLDSAVLFSDLWVLKMECLKDNENYTYTWEMVQLNSGLKPPIRWKQGMVNVGEGKVLLFGGEDANINFLNDLWLFDYSKKTWQEISVPILTTKPSSLRDFGFASLGNGKVLLLGGAEYDPIKPENIILNPPTWIFDINTQLWEKNNFIFSASGIIGNYFSYGIKDFSMSDITDNHVVFFSGYTWDNINSVNVLYDKTWLFDFSQMNWQQVITTNGTPLPRQLSSSSKLSNNKIIYFGGVRSSTNLSDTWILDIIENTWTQITSSITSPEHRQGHQMSKIADGIVILFGGYNGNNTLNDTWIYRE